MELRGNGCVELFQGLLFPFQVLKIRDVSLQSLLPRGCNARLFGSFDLCDFLPNSFYLRINRGDAGLNSPYFFLASLIG